MMACSWRFKIVDNNDNKSNWNVNINFGEYICINISSCTNWQNYDLGRRQYHDQSKDDTGETDRVEPTYRKSDRKFEREQVTSVFFKLQSKSLGQKPEVCMTWRWQVIPSKRYKFHEFPKIHKQGSPRPIVSSIVSLILQLARYLA